MEVIKPSNVWIKVGVLLLLVLILFLCGFVSVVHVLVIMETFCAMARFKGEGRLLQFTVLTTWEVVVAEICERWSLQASRVIMMFVAPNSYGTVCPIESDADFQCMCHIHHTYKKSVVDIIVEEVSGASEATINISLPTLYDNHSKASKKWIGDCIMQRLKERPLYRAIDIQKDIIREHGMRLPYKHVWMGREVARSAIHGNEVSSYHLLLWYADKVAETNPGALWQLRRTGSDSNTFSSLSACLCKDRNEGIFHVVFAIVDNKTDDNWTWFLAILGEAIYGEDDYREIITFISDWSKGLINSVTRVFPSSPHGYCLRHLVAKFMKANAKLGKTLCKQCWDIIVRIAYAYTVKEFDDAITELAMKSPEAHNWLLYKSNVDHWANYLFKGMRWCEMYSNIAESFNGWVKEARHLPVTSLVDSIRFKLMNMMAGCAQASKWDTHLCLGIHKKVELIIKDSRFLWVGRSMTNTYEILDNDINAVSLRNQKCSCKKWEVHGLSCKHACAAIMQTDMNMHSYVADYFTVEWYRRAYAEPIHPIPDTDKPSDGHREL
ncbi:uncharacterized protein LOC120277771 [Dioscorea cayenensis subsp. rotundata]|uniref:Uncharacterized protein LOC120277771 n=1 Tax=Dioscorea cayennensis subsp. rotundata TaxID=55577 RepID=A0AB40CL48_DIOCR|nr:uncharacterized protein LOC120277771 [Dioscorea cayenensis subsp. rotundata]